MTSPTHYIPIHGTWDLGNDAWWRHGSSFCELTARYGLVCEEQFETFYWSGLVDGINLKTVLTLGLIRDQHETWDSAGLSLRNRLKLSELEGRNLIVHSHGLQVLAYSNILVNNIISVGSPIREDMFPLYELLEKNSNSWLHIYDEIWDKIEFLGQIGDGKWFGSRNCPYAINHKLKKIGHSKILREEEYMKLWISEGWFDFLKQERRIK